MITNIEYMYRDFSNYKYYGQFAVSGNISKCDLEEYLFDGMSFNPLKIGLPHLLTDPLNDDDHMMHELLEFSNIESGKIFCSADELKAKFEKFQNLGWFNCQLRI